MTRVGKFFNFYKKKINKNFSNSPKVFCQPCKSANSKRKGQTAIHTLGLINFKAKMCVYEKIFFFFALVINLSNSECVQNLFFNHTRQ